MVLQASNVYLIMFEKHHQMFFFMSNLRNIISLISFNICFVISHTLCYLWLIKTFLPKQNPEHFLYFSYTDNFNSPFIRF